MSGPFEMIELADAYEREAERLIRAALKPDWGADGETDFINAGGAIECLKCADYLRARAAGESA